MLVRAYESDDHLTEKQVRSKRNTGASPVLHELVDIIAVLQGFIQELEGGEPLLPSLTLERPGLEVRVDGVVGAAQLPHLPRGADQTLPLFCSLRALKNDLNKCKFDKSGILQCWGAGDECRVGRN